MFDRHHRRAGSCPPRPGDDVQRPHRAAERDEQRAHDAVDDVPPRRRRRRGRDRTSHHLDALRIGGRLLEHAERARERQAVADIRRTPHGYHAGSGNAHAPRHRVGSRRLADRAHRWRDRPGRHQKRRRPDHHPSRATRTGMVAGHDREQPRQDGPAPRRRGTAIGRTGSRAREQQGLRPRVPRHQGRFGSSGRWVSRRALHH